MDPSDIVRYGSELASVGAAVSAAVPLTAVVKRMLGPAADEIAERVRDEIRLYRYKRQLALLRKAEAIAVEAGYTPKAVSTKLLFGLLEGASLEENEDIHDMWAALLANAASPSLGDWVRPSFADVLKLMTPEVARFLNTLYKRAENAIDSDKRVPASHLGIRYEERETRPASPALRMRDLTLVDLGTYIDLFAMFGDAGTTFPSNDTAGTTMPDVDIMDRDAIDRQSFAIVMDELFRFQMWSVVSGRSSGDHYYLSPYAVQFVAACSRPTR